MSEFRSLEEQMEENVFSQINSQELREQLKNTFRAGYGVFSDALPICAEIAMKHNDLKAAQATLDIYFASEPGQNQCIARAYLCQAQLNEPKDFRDTINLGKCSEWIQKAVNFGRNAERHYFLVFNASVLYWKLCQPFLRKGSRRHLCSHLKTIVEALDEIQEKDYELRAELMIELVKCYVDGDMKDAAAKSASCAFKFCEEFVAERLEDILTVQVQEGLADLKLLQKGLKLQYLYCLSKFLWLRGVNDDDVFTSEVEKLSHLIEEVKKTKRTAAVQRKPMTSENRVSLLVKLAHLCVEREHTAQADAIVQRLPSDFKKPEIVLEFEYLQCLLSIKKLGVGPESRSGTVLKRRQLALRRSYETLQSAIRMNNPSMIQAGCALVWNLSLPLLQPDLRHIVAKPLRLVAETLEKISSMLYDLRCKVHMELAKCEEDEDKIDEALASANAAKNFDFDKKFTQELLLLINRLQLRSTSSGLPAAITEANLAYPRRIVEQISSVPGICSEDTYNDVHDVLVEAGRHIAPLEFDLTLDEDLDRGKTKVRNADRRSDFPEDKKKTVDESRGGMKGGETESKEVKPIPLAQKLEEEVTQYELAAKKTHDHLASISVSEDVKRVLLWADLAKLACKQKIWDIAQTAARFCTLYNDGRWQLPPTIASEDGGSFKPISKLNVKGSFSTGLLLQPSRSQIPLKRKGGSLPVGLHFREEKMALSQSSVAVSSAQVDGLAESVLRKIVRTLGEVHLVYAESLIVLLQKKGLNLCVEPSLTGMRMDDSVKSTDRVWLNYRKWIAEISHEVVESCHRAAKLGCDLQEPWLVSQSMVCLFNATVHMTKKRQEHLVSFFMPLINTYKMTDGFKEKRDYSLLCRMATSVAEGMLKQSMAARLAGKKWTESTAKKTDLQDLPSDPGHESSVDPSRKPTDRKSAVELAEYVLGVCAMEGVPLLLRKDLIVAWVQLKFSLSLPIPKPKYEQKESDPLFHQLCAVIAVEIIGHKGEDSNGSSSTPTMAEAFDVVQNCTWSDALVPLELFTSLAGCCFKERDYSLSDQCCKKALSFADVKMKGQYDEKLAEHLHIHRCELLSQAAQIQGQVSFHLESDGVKQRRTALDSFLTSAKHAHKAKNYDLLMLAARHVWNTCQPVVGEPLERELMRGPVSQLLSMIADVTGRKKEIGTSEKDLEFRIWLYSIVFMSYADNGEWNEGLKAVDNAIWIMPKSAYRLLAKYRLLFKNKLGKPVLADMQRSLDENEEVQAALWHDVAVSSVSVEEQFNAYHAAIEITKDKWRKVTWLMEFGNWLFNNGLPRYDAMAQLEKAARILVAFGEEAAVVESRRCKQLLLLARVSVMVAQMVGTKSEKYLGRLVEATKFYKQIWKIQEPLFNSLGSEEKGQTEEAGGKDDKKGRKSKMVKRKSTFVGEFPAKFVLPVTASQWASFQLPSEMRDRLRKETNSSAFSKANLDEPIMEAYYMDVLVSELMDRGLHFLALPVLCLHLLLAQDIIESVEVVNLAELRMSECCQALGLVDALHQHEQAFSGSSFPLQERIECLSEIEIREDKKRLALLEDQRRKGADQTGGSGEGEGQSDGKCKEMSSKYAVPVLERVELRKTWADQADILLDQGRYQLARDRYHLSRNLALAHGDVPTLIKSLCGLSRLALLEGETAEAIALATEAQKHRADPYTYLKVILAFVNALLADPEREGEARLVLINAMGTFHELAQDKPDMGSECGFIWATLLAKLAKVRFESLGDLGLLRRRARKKRELDVALKEYRESWEKLLELHWISDAVEVMMEHSVALRAVAEETTDGSQRHQRLLEAHFILERARQSAATWVRTVESLLGQSELKGIVLPSERLLLKVVSEVGEGLWLVMDEDGHKRQEKWQTEKRASIVEKLFEEYAVTTPEPSETEESWQQLARFASSHSVALLSAAYGGISCKWPRLHSVIGIKLGRCLCLMSEQINMAGSCPWAIKEEETPETPKNPEKNDSDEESEDSETDSHKDDNDEEVEIRNEEQTALMYLSQGIEILSKSVHEAVQAGDLEAGGAGALHLVRCYGRRDPVQAAVCLSLYQSCQASLWMKSLLMTALKNPLVSQLASLMHQRHQIRETNTCLTLEENTRILEKEEAYRRLQVQPNQHELLPNLPLGLCFVTIQHTPDRKHLYGSITRPYEQKPFIAYTESDPSLLSGLIDDVAENRDDWAQHLLRLDFFHYQARQQASADDGGRLSLKDRQEPIVMSRIMAAQKIGEEIEERFLVCIKAMDAYLEPLTSQLPIQECLEDVSAVVLLADEWLLKLPLECLNWLRCCRDRGLARDASLQLFYHRFYGRADGHSPDVSPGKKDKSGKKEKSAPTPKREGKEKDEKKRDRKASVIKPEVPETVPVDLSQVKYILDPHTAFSEKNENDPSSQIQSSIKSLGTLTSKWSGLTGQDGIPSVGQWTETLKNSSSFFFFGSERCLAHLSPCYIPSLNLAGCGLAVLADRAQTGQTYLKQSKLDANKSPAQQNLENSIEAAILLSLAGVKGVVVNQWATTADTNSQMIRDLLKALLPGSNPIGQALQHIKYPPRQTEEPSQAEQQTDGISAEDKETHTENDLEERLSSKTNNPVLYGLPNILFNPPK